MKKTFFYKKERSIIQKNTSTVKNYNINTPAGDDTILSYGGGPGSVFGIGKTNVKFATTNAGVPIKTLANFGYNKNNPLTSNYKTWDYSLISNFKPPTDSSDKRPASTRVVADILLLDVTDLVMTNGNGEGDENDDDDENDDNESE